ncbi:MAG TPA: hypothetical protein QF703_04150 [Candidatus Thalassarchaeaceae archaeon]|nr:hypothetical protein [Candidatus Thalassarchaeaceae archaeon]
MINLHSGEQENRSRRSIWAVLFITTIVTLLFGSSNVIGQGSTAYDGPGFDAFYPEESMLYLKGVEDNLFIDRNWTTITGLPAGSSTFSKTNPVSLNTVYLAQTSAVQEPTPILGNITIALFASLETSSSVCSSTNVISGTPLGADTQFFVSLRISGNEVISDLGTNSIVMTNDWTDPHIFEARAEGVNVSMNTGDYIEIEVKVRHECSIPGALWWGTYDARSSIAIEGSLIEVELNVVIDRNRMARVEFTPVSPWGPDDFSSQFIELVGPVDWDEMAHGHLDENSWTDHFEIPHGFSKGVSNRTILTWSTIEPLVSGSYMLDACFTLSDQDPGAKCDSWAILRFTVPEDDKPMLRGEIGAFLVPISLLLWIGVSIRSTMLPLPAYAAVVILAMACAGTASQLPDVDSEPYREGAAAPSFILLSHDPERGAVSLSDLIADSDVVVVGVFTPGSPNAIRQMGDFEIAQSILENEGRSPSFVQIATGEGLQAINLDDYAQVLNGTWPLLMDDSTFGRELPGGPTDSVIVIDSAGFVSHWEPGSMSPTEIQKAVISASFGSDNSPLDIISLLIGIVLLPLFALSLPSERRYDSPDSPLIPGVGGFLTVYASFWGFCLLALPLSVLPALGFAAFWRYLEAFIALMMVYHGLSMLRLGKIHEIEAISRVTHLKLPEEYRKWRSLARHKEDVYLGLWLSWLLWISDPSMIPQGVGGVARSGLFGLAVSPLIFVAFGICAGITVLITRMIAMAPGSIAGVIGSLSVGIRHRSWGLATAIMGVWVLISIISGPIVSNL